MARSIVCSIVAFVTLVFAVPAPPSQAADKAVVRKLIKDGVAYLRSELKKKGEIGDGASFLAAYAMIKGGVKPTDPVIQKAVKAVVEKTKGGKYKPRSEVIYTTGVELMLLEAARVKTTDYREPMQIIVDFVVEKQSDPGYWNYLGGDKVGDTSVTQYGILGLWAAARAGIKVPPKAWDKAAGWLLATQKTNGGWQYRPQSSLDTHGVTTSMTVAGVSTLLVTARYLYPGRVDGNSKRKPKKKVFSLNRNVEKVDISNPEEKRKRSKSGKKIDPSNYKPSASFGRIRNAARGGLGWLNARYTPGNGRWKIYTLYGVERLSALMRLERIGKHHWYDSGVEYLAKTQSPNGTWSDTTGILPATSFAVLFLTRSTAKLLGVPVESLGDGLLRGGTGLPDDLSSIGEGKDGKIKKRKISGPIDELLAELQKPQTDLDVPELQKAIVKKIQLGDRKQWLKPEKRKQLLSMAEHPKPEVRTVAIWALGRTGNIDIVTIIMNALEKDPDLIVAIEARNALCWLSRKPKGFGLANDPRTDLPPNASKAQKEAAIDKWRSEAVSRWKKWYLSVRPYDERDDLKDTPDAK